MRPASPAEFGANALPKQRRAKRRALGPKFPSIILLSSVMVSATLLRNQQDRFDVSGARKQ
jgi:hypothetical protein